MVKSKNDVKPSALVITTLMGYGDMLYLTPFIHFLNLSGFIVDVWAYNTEPLQNNPDIHELKKIVDKKVNIPEKYKESYWIFQKFESNANNMHTVDYFTTKACNFTLRNKEKSLVFKWSRTDTEYCQALLEKHNLISNESYRCNFVVINPAITWPSRTLPLTFYKELIEKIQTNGDRVVLVGKDITPAKNNLTSSELASEESKSLYPVAEFPNAVDLTNQLSFSQLAALYSLSKIAINSENGSMVTSCTNDFCWNLYIPTLNAPDFRLPYRRGSQHYRTIVVGNELDYYPPTDYAKLLAQRGLFDYLNSSVLCPTVDEVFQAYLHVNGLFHRGVVEEGGSKC